MTRFQAVGVMLAAVVLPLLLMWWRYALRWWQREEDWWRDDGKGQHP